MNTNNILFCRINIQANPWIVEVLYIKKLVIKIAKESQDIELVTFSYKILFILRYITRLNLDKCLVYNLFN